jgi:hypothetical protein
MKTKLGTKSAFLISILTLSACKIAGEKRPTPSNDTVVMNFFVAESYALQNESLSAAMSSLYGFTMAAAIDATFESWSKPKHGCLYKAQDGLNFSPKRSIDIGNVKLSGVGLLEDLARDPDSFTFSSSGRLPEGEYSLRGNDLPSVAFDQSFRVLAPGAQLLVLSGAEGDLQTLPSPRIPASSDADFTITINKLRPLLVGYQAPQHTNYVKIEVSDGTTNAESSVVCYGAPDEPIVIPEGALSYFRSTEDGRLTIEFVSTSLETSFPNIKESFIKSSTKHIHGLVDFYTDTQKQTARFGVLKFE